MPAVSIVEMPVSEARRIYDAGGPLAKQLEIAYTAKRVRLIPDKQTGWKPPSLTDFVEATTPWKLEKWQRIICDRLERLTNETGQRLLIHGPPQLGKSILISQRFPAWLMGSNPLYRMRLACYNITHAERFSRVNLEIMRQAEYEDYFPDPACRVPKICAAEEWSTVGRHQIRDAQPSMKALGLNTGFVGLGVDLLVIDDPYRSRQDAFSEAINEGVWMWWKDTVLPRLNPETNVVVMFHRWKQDDLAGRLIEQGGWEQLRFPAIADEGPDDPTDREIGESLSKRYPKEFLANVREQIGEESWMALYGGSPIQEGGNYFRCGRLQHASIYTDSYDFPLLRIYQGWDLAIGQKETNDYTVGATVGVDGDQNLYILDVVRERFDFNETLEAIESAARKWTSGPQRIQSIGIESNAYQVSAFQEACRRYMLPFQSVVRKRGQDKVYCAQLLRQRIGMGKVFVNTGSSWWPELQKELLLFPSSKHDDQVDSLVNALEMLPLGEMAASDLHAPSGSISAVNEEREREAEGRRSGAMNY